LRITRSAWLSSTKPAAQAWSNEKTQVQALTPRKKFLSMAVFTFIVVGVSPAPSWRGRRVRIGAQSAGQRLRRSDICGPLIDLWNVIKTVPKRLLERYEAMWAEMGARGKEFYCEVRRAFNESADPCEFFLSCAPVRIGFVPLHPSR